MSVSRLAPGALGLWALATAACPGDTVVPPVCTPTSGVVSHVRDGDTIELEDGTPVRLLLVDTPEVSSDDCFAAEAKELTEQLVLGREVELEYDADQCFDMFDRHIAYVYVDGHLLNRILIERGYARLYIIHPASHPEPYALEEEFTALAAAAEAEGAGLWGVCE